MHVWLPLVGAGDTLAEGIPCLVRAPTASVGHSVAMAGMEVPTQPTVVFAYATKQDWIYMEREMRNKYFLIRKNWI